MQRDYDEYRGAHSGTSEYSREAGANSVSLKKTVEQKLLQDEAVGTKDATKEGLSTVRQLVQSMGRAVPVIRNGYGEPVRDLASDL